jgi:hypothetical protein
MDAVTIRERVRELREEIAEINRLNKEYRHLTRASMTEVGQYSHRRDRLIAISLELAALKKEKAA